MIEKALVPNAAKLTPFGEVRKERLGRDCGLGFHEHCLRPSCECACHTPGTGRYRIPGRKR